MSEIVFTRSGKCIDPDRPRPADILATDIAEAVAKHPMYAGATIGFYSLAQHSTILAGEAARAVGAIAALYTLLLHAPVALCPTAAHPLRLGKAIAKAFGLDWPIAAAMFVAIEHLDAGVRLTELRQLCRGCEDRVAVFEKSGAKPLPALIRPMAWDRACDRYLATLRLYIVTANLPVMPSFGDIL